MPRRSLVEFEQVKRLIGEGLTDESVALATGVPRETVRGWRRREAPPASAVRIAEADGWSIPDPRVYCYLLGSYLGDGHITHRPPNGWTIRIFCDCAYEAVISEVFEALHTTFAGPPPRRTHCSSGDADVLALSHAAIGRAFPQHGSGRKHERRIELADWQRGLTHAHPEALIRGLIHSDGCRSINRFSTRLPSGRVAEYAYPRYFFTNHSADIRAIFVEHCGLLGIRVTQPNHRNLAVSHRRSVAMLEEIVGPKT